MKYTEALTLVGAIDERTQQLALAAIDEDKRDTGRYDHFNRFTERVVDDLLLPAAAEEFERRCLKATGSEIIEHALQMICDEANTDEHYFER